MAVESRAGWRFFRAGGFDQAVIDSAPALTSLDTLDQKLWAALSCPVHGIECDPVTLALIDADSDGHIRPAEIIAAVAWAASRLKDPAILLERRADLPLSAVDDARPEGRDLLAAARRMLAAQQKEGAETISAGDALEGEKLFAQMPFNGDGIVPEAAAEDDFTRTVLADIVSCLGGIADRSGQPGVDADRLAAFFKELDVRAAWLRRFEEDPALRPAGDETAAAEAALAAVEAKIDDYFIRAGLAAFDPRSVAAMNGSLEDWQALAARLLAGTEERLAAFPLAPVAPDQPLPLQDGLNPLWRARMETFRLRVVQPLLGPIDHLSEAQWRQLQSAFAAFRRHQADKPADHLDRLAAGRVHEILASPAETTIAGLIARDQALAGEAAAMTSVGRLVRYLRDLAMLIDNFVSFADFYGRRRAAVFQAGTLYIDQRACSLCIRVDSVEKHAVLAAMGRIYLLYCECRRPQTDGRIYIAAAVTAGDSDQLLVGRNGIFYDRQGRDWDATVIRIVDHPISIRQAFLSPYKKVGRMVATQLEKFASDRSTAVQTGAAAALSDPAKLAAPPAAAGAAAPQPFDAGRFAGIFATLALAVGAIGTAVASVVTGFLRLPWWEVPLAILGIFALISGPSVAIAAFKLRLRTIGPLLDANGWAVNTRAGITIAFGAALTAEARLPKGAARQLRDPYAGKGPNWLVWGLAAGIVLGLAAVWHWRLWTALAP